MDVITIERGEIFDDMGWPLPPWVNEGYDIMGFPVTRLIGIIVLDGRGKNPDS